MVSEALFLDLEHLYDAYRAFSHDVGAASLKSFNRKIYDFQQAFTMLAIAESRELRRAPLHIAYLMSMQSLCKKHVATRKTLRMDVLWA